MGTLLSSFFLFLQEDGDSLARERERGDNWTDWITAVNTKGWALFIIFFFYFCRKMVTASPERERERGDNWTDWITVVNTKGWALSIIIFFLFLQEDGDSLAREREVTTGLIGSLL